MHVMFSWCWNKTVQFLERCPWQRRRKGQSEARMHNDQYPLLHSLNTELFDIKSDLTTLSGSADNSAHFPLIKFYNLSRIIQLFCKKCKKVISHFRYHHSAAIWKGKTRTHSDTDMRHLTVGRVKHRAAEPAFVLNPNCTPYQ